MKFVTSTSIEQLDFKAVILRRDLSKERNCFHGSMTQVIMVLGHFAEEKVQLALLGNFAPRLERP